MLSNLPKCQNQLIPLKGKLLPSFLSSYPSSFLWIKWGDILSSWMVLTSKDILSLVWHFGPKRVITRHISWLWSKQGWLSSLRRILWVQILLDLKILFSLPWCYKGPNELGAPLTLLFWASGNEGNRKETHDWTIFQNSKVLLAFFYPFQNQPFNEIVRLSWNLYLKHRKRKKFCISDPLVITS